MRPLNLDDLRVESFVIPGYGRCTVCTDPGEIDAEGVCVFCQPCPDCGEEGGDCPIDGCGANGG